VARIRKRHRCATELLDKLTLRLSYSPAPLEDAQTAQLVTLFNTSRRGALAGGGPPSPVSDAFIAGAQSILKPEQMAGLLQLKTELDASRGGSSVSIRSATPPVLRRRRRVHRAADQVA